MTKLTPRKKGSECVAIVKSALDDISQGLVQDASTKLDGLKQDGRHLASEAKKIAKRVEAAKDHCVCKVEKVQKEIAELSCNESNLTQQKSSEQASLNSNQSILWQNESSLSSAQNDVREAERKLERAKEKERKSIGTGIFFGALLGAVTGGVGLAVGAAAGAGVAAIVNECQEDEKRARNRLERCRNNCQSARSAVEASRSRISSIESQIRSLEVQIEDLKRRQQPLSDKAGKMKKSIVLCMQFTQFWEEFNVALEHATDRTARLQAIVDKANEMGDYGVLSSGGSKLVSISFLEAWETIETLNEKSSSYVLQIEFDCACCATKHTALPHVDEQGHLNCDKCNIQHMIQN